MEETSSKEIVITAAPKKIIRAKRTVLNKIPDDILNNQELQLSMKERF